MAKKKNYIKINLDHQFTYTENFLKHLRGFVDNINKDDYEFILYFYFQNPEADILGPLDADFLIDSKSDSVLEFPYAQRTPETIELEPIIPIQNNIVDDETSNIDAYSGLYSNTVNGMLSITHSILSELSTLLSEISTAYVVSNNYLSVECIGRLLDKLLDARDNIKIQNLVIANAASYGAFYSNSLKFSSLKNLYVYLDGSGSYYEKTKLKELASALRQLKDLKLVKFLSPSDASNQGSAAKLLVSKAEDINYFVKAIENIRISADDLELILDIRGKGEGNYNKIVSLIQSELYLSVLPSFFNSFVCSKACVTLFSQLLPSAAPVTIGEYVGYPYHDWDLPSGFLEALGRVLKKSSDINLTSIANEVKLLQRAGGHLISDNYSFSKVRIFGQAKPSKINLKAILSDFFSVEEDMENIANFIVDTKSGQKFILSYKDLSLLGDIAFLEGCENVLQSADKALLEGFWRAHGVFKGDGVEFNGLLLSKMELNNIASFLKDKDIPTQKSTLELQFIDEQMDAVGRDLGTQYVNAIDGRIRDYQAHYNYLREVIGDRGEEIFFIPILINANTEAYGEYGNHWVLYFHNGLGEDGEPIGYIIDPLSDAAYQRSINNIRELIGEVFGGRSAAIEYIQAGVQTDSYNCGPWVLYFMQQLQAQLANRGPSIPMEELIRDTLGNIRDNHLGIDIIRENYGNLQPDLLEPGNQENTFINEWTAAGNSTSETEEELTTEDPTNNLQAPSLENLGYDSSL